MRPLTWLSVAVLLDLNMPASRIEKLSERGRCAGEKLSRRFSPSGDGTPLIWDNHRWVRYRSTMQLLEEALRMFNTAYNWPAGAAQTCGSLITRTACIPPESYRWRDSAQEQAAVQATTDFVNWRCSSPGPTFSDGAPRPEPELRIKPRL